MANSLKKQVMRHLKQPSRLLAMGIAAGLMGVVGIPAPSLSGLPLVTQSAIAQSTVSSEEITQYARAVLEMDPYRTDAYTEIKDLLLTVNMDISEVNVSCSSAQDVSNVPRSVRRQVREILIAYCNQAQEIVEANGLTSRRFNEITEAHQEDNTLFERIQQELIRLQQG